MMLAMVGGVSAQGFYAGAGVDFFMISDSDDLEDAGFSTSLIGFTPKVGYQINEMFGVNAGYKYFLANEGDGGAEYSQSAISILANVSPFKDGGLMPLYFIGGIDLVTYEMEMDLGVLGTFTADESETGIVLGAGYGWMLGEKFSLNPEVTYVTGDAGGINIEVGARFHF